MHDRHREGMQFVQNSGKHVIWSIGGQARLNIMPRRELCDSSKSLSVEQAWAKLAEAMRDLAAGHDPGPITFRSKRTKKTDETYPLRLTQQQRESMIHGATPITWPPSGIRSTNAIGNCWRGGGHSTPKPSIRRGQRRP
jgi:hypothetical protein